MIGIIQGNGHVSKSLWLSKLRSRKDHILHTGATKLLDPLFTKYPADRISNIALTTAVRSNDSGDSVVELKDDLIGK